MKMDGLISEQEMAQLNDLVENQGHNEKKVAQDFCVKNPCWHLKPFKQ